jgi:hypothetical protein
VTSFWHSPWIVFVIASAGAGLLFVFFVLVTQMALRNRRLKRFQDLELIPNILLTTQHPVLFIGRNRSLFRLSGDFLELPIYLREHGFQVEEVELRTRGLKKADDSQSAFHFFASANSKRTVTQSSPLLAGGLCGVGARSCFQRSPRTRKLNRHRFAKMSPMQLRPPRVPLHVRPDLKPQIAKFDFQTERSALDHVVSLAEFDLR